MSQINTVIRSRKSVYPPQYISKAIPKEIIEELLENANHAPTHRLTEPWRFKIFMDEKKEELGKFLASKYSETAEVVSEAKIEKIQNNAKKAGAILAIVLHRDPKESVPEWEEIAAVACAVQNLWIACDQYEIGGYWSSPGYAKKLGEFVSLKQNEQCLGFFFMGYYQPTSHQVKKKPIAEKIEWFS
ncbi:MAG: nitroreductase [Bacteroidota bacterium]